MSNLVSGVRRRVVEIAELAEIAIFIGLLYVFFLAPALIVRGEAEPRDFVVGLVGLSFWGFAIVNLEVLV